MINKDLNWHAERRQLMAKYELTESTRLRVKWVWAHWTLLDEHYKVGYLDHWAMGETLYETRYTLEKELNRVYAELALEYQLPPVTFIIGRLILDKYGVNV